MPRLQRRSILGLAIAALTLSILLVQAGCLMFASYAVAGSHSPRRNVTKKPEHWGGFEPGQLLALKRDVFIADLPNYSFGLALAPGKEFGLGGKGYWAGETTVSEYKANPEKWPDMKGIVDKGTRLECLNLYTYKYFFGDKREYLIKAQILEGPWKDKVVEICELSWPVSKTSYARKPHPELLEPLPPSHDTPETGALSRPALLPDAK